MTQAQKLQRRILAVLEEAGEDDIAALVNTVGKNRGSFDEIELISEALRTLVCGEFMELARVRDEASLHWKPLPVNESLELLSDLRAYFQWSANEKLWKWLLREHRVETLLTPDGLTAAQKVLAEDGWPD